MSAYIAAAYIAGILTDALIQRLLAVKKTEKRRSQLPVPYPSELISGCWPADPPVAE